MKSEPYKVEEGRWAPARFGMSSLMAVVVGRGREYSGVWTSDQAAFVCRYLNDIENGVVVPTPLRHEPARG